MLSAGNNMKTMACVALSDLFKGLCVINPGGCDEACKKQFGRDAIGWCYTLGLPKSTCACKYDKNPCHL